MIKKTCIGIGVLSIALISAKQTIEQVTTQWNTFSQELKNDKVRLADLQKHYEKARHSVYQTLLKQYHLDLNKLGRLTPEEAPHKLSKREARYHQKAQKLIDALRDMQHILFANLTRPKRKLPLTVNPEQLKSMMRDYMIPRVTESYHQITQDAQKQSAHTTWNDVTHALHNAIIKQHDLQYLDTVMKLYLAAKDHTLTTLKEKHHINLNTLLKPFALSDDKKRAAALQQLSPKEQAQAHAAQNLRTSLRNIEQTLGLNWSSDDALASEDKTLIATKYIPSIEQAYHDMVHPQPAPKKKTKKDSDAGSSTKHHPMKKSSQ